MAQIVLGTALGMRFTGLSRGLLLRGTALALAAEIGPDLLFSVLEEKTRYAMPSTIIDASGSEAKVLRPGPISEAEVLAV